VNLDEAQTSIQGLALFERDESGDLMHVWSFPGVDETTKTIMLTRSQLSDELISKRHQYLYFRSNNVWHYSLASYSITVPKKQQTGGTVSFCIELQNVQPRKVFSPVKNHDCRVQ
jgi:hypothetical protein